MTIMMAISESGITTIESQDKVAIHRTVRTTPMPMVFRVNMAANIIGINAKSENPWYEKYWLKNDATDPMFIEASRHEE